MLLRANCTMQTYLADDFLGVEVASQVPLVGGPPDASFGFYLRYGMVL